MTARDVITRHVRRVNRGLNVAVGIVLLSLAMTTAIATLQQPPNPLWGPSLWVVGIIGGAIVLAWNAEFARKAIRCPSCRGDLSTIASHPRTFSRAQVCPYCAHSFDDEQPTVGKSEKQEPSQGELA